MLAVDLHVGLLELAVGRPASDRVQHRVELVLGALLDPHLPALVVQWDEIGLRKRNEIADELRR